MWIDTFYRDFTLLLSSQKITAMSIAYGTHVFIYDDAILLNYCLLYISPEHPELPEGMGLVYSVHPQAPSKGDSEMFE